MSTGVFPGFRLASDAEDTSADLWHSHSDPTSLLLPVVQAKRSDAQRQAQHLKASNESVAKLISLERHLIDARLAKLNIAETIDELMAVTSLLTLGTDAMPSRATSASGSLSGVKTYGTVGTAAAARASTARLQALINASGTASATTLAPVLEFLFPKSQILTETAAALKSGNTSHSPSMEAKLYLLQQLANQLSLSLVEIYLSGDPAAIGQTLCPLLELVSDPLYPTRQVTAFNILFNVAMRVDVVFYVQRGGTRASNNAQDLFHAVSSVQQRKNAAPESLKRSSSADKDDETPGTHASLSASVSSSTPSASQVYVTPSRATDVVSYCRLSLLTSLAELLLCLVQQEVTAPEVWEAAIKCIFFFTQRSARTKQRLLALVDCRVWPTLLMRTLPSTQSSFEVSMGGENATPVIQPSSSSHGAGSGGMSSSSSSSSASSSSSLSSSSAVPAMRFLSPICETEIASLWQQSLFRFGGLDVAQLANSTLSIPGSGVSGIGAVLTLFVRTRSILSKQCLFQILFYYCAHQIGLRNAKFQADAPEIHAVFDFLQRHVFAYQSFDSLCKFVPDKFVETVSCCYLVALVKRAPQIASAVQGLSKKVLVAILYEIEQVAAQYAKMDSTLLQSLPCMTDSEKMSMLRSLLHSADPVDRNQGERWLFNLLLENLSRNAFKLKKSSHTTPESVLIDLLSSSNPKVRQTFLRVSEKILLFHQSSKSASPEHAEEVVKVLNDCFGLLLAIQEKDEANLVVLCDILLKFLCQPTDEGLAEGSCVTLAELFLDGKAVVLRHLLESINIGLLQHLVDNLPSDFYDTERAALLLLIIELCRVSPVLLESVGGRSYFRRLCASASPRLALHASEFLIEMFKTAHGKEYEQFFKFWSSEGGDARKQSAHLLENPFLQLNAIMEKLQTSK